MSRKIAFEIVINDDGTGHGYPLHQSVRPIPLPSAQYPSASQSTLVQAQPGSYGSLPPTSQPQSQQQPVVDTGLASRALSVAGLYAINQTLGKFAAASSLLKEVASRIEENAKLQKRLLDEQVSSIQQAINDKFQNAPIHSQISLDPHEVSFLKNKGINPRLAVALYSQASRAAAASSASGAAAGAGATAGAGASGAAAASGTAAGFAAVAAPLAVFAGVLFAAAYAGKKLIEAFNRAADRFGEFAPQTAAAQATREAQQTIGDVRRAQLLDDRLAEYVTIQTELSQIWQDIKAILLKASLDTIIPILRQITDIIQGMADIIRSMIEFARPALEKLIAFVDALPAIAKATPITYFWQIFANVSRAALKYLDSKDGDDPMAGLDLLFPDLPDFKLPAGVVPFRSPVDFPAR